MNLAPELLLNLLVYLPIAGVAMFGLIVLRRRGERRFPLPRLRRGRWSGGEVLLCFLLFALVPSVILVILDEAGVFFSIFDKHVSRLRQFILLSPLTLALLFAIYFNLLYRMSGTQPTHVGLTLARWRANVRLGLAAFCVTTPIVLGLYVLAQLLTNHVPHEYEKLLEEDLRVFEWYFLALAAIVLPPLLEEWLFRGLLQGWLRRASPLGHIVVGLIALYEGSAPLLASILKQRDDANTPILWESLVFALLIVGVYFAGVLKLWWPVFQSGLSHFVEQPPVGDVGMTAGLDQIEGQIPVLLPSGPRWEAFKHANARWAIVGSATLFALMHEAWPAAVALWPLGLVLGWLAYRTQSLIPGIVLHALFNTLAYFVLLFSKP